MVIIGWLVGTAIFEQTIDVWMYTRIYRIYISPCRDPSKVSLLVAPRQKLRALCTSLQTVARRGGSVSMKLVGGSLMKLRTEVAMGQAVNHQT